MALLSSPVEEIKSRLSLAEVVQEYIPLKRAGANFKAVCPFHSEKTPSFMVSADKQIWHCFGCGEGGDVFAFVMKMEGLEFGDALRLLAKKAGVELSRQDPHVSTKRNRLLSLVSTAAQMYRTILSDSPKAENVRAYVRDRGVSDITRDTFLLGYAPDTWDVLLEFLTKRKFTEREMEEAGLVVRKTDASTGMRGYYDRFRDRLMFTICDTHGNPVGFGGRMLKKDDTGAKYINTPATGLYDKSNILYALHLAKAAIRKAKVAVVVEGYMDALSSHQAGVENVVAASGTALTMGQIDLIKRYAPSAILAFDMDIAGDTATRRGIDLAIESGLDVRIAQLPHGKDPDELIRVNPEEWKTALTKSVSVIEYYFTSATKGKDFGNVQHKKEITRTLLPVIKKIPNTVEQSHYLQKLGALVRVTESVLRDALTATKIERARQGATPKTLSRAPRTEDVIMSERLLALALTFPLDVKAETLPDPAIISEYYRPLYTEFLSAYNSQAGEFSFEDFWRTLKEKDQSLADLAGELSLLAEKDFADFGDGKTEAVRKDIKTAARRLMHTSLRRELKELERRLKEAEAARQSDEVDTLTRHLSELSRRIKQYE